MPRFCREKPLLYTAAFHSWPLSVDAGQGDAVFTGGEPQAVFLAGDGIVAAGVIVQAELLIFAAGDSVQGQARGAGGGRQVLLAEERS